MTPPTAAAKKKDERPADSVASPKENAKLEHTDKDAPATTRDDTLDAGVPMAPAEDPAAERVGPEDAMGPEATRGDYSGRIDSGPHLASVPTSAEERAGEEVHVDADGEQVDKPGKGTTTFREPGPRAKLVEQGPATPGSGALDE
jgi:hypothetical protein